METNEYKHYKISINNGKEQNTNEKNQAEVESLLQRLVDTWNHEEPLD
jgi:hypothetical protein